MHYAHYLKEVTFDNVINAICDYEQNECPLIRKRYRYYNGDHDINKKTTSGDRANNRIVDNKLRAIADTYLGFINPGGIETKDAYFLDVIEEVQDAIKDCIITGVGYTLTFYDTRITLKRIKPTGAMVFRDTSLSHNVIGGAFWDRHNVVENGISKEHVELYIVDEKKFYHYEGITLEGSKLIADWSHNIPGIPLIEYKITSHYDSVIAPGIPLQDLVNITLSSYADGRSDFSDPFLMVTGIGIDEDSAKDLINGDRKLLNLPLPDADAKYLIKEDSGSDLVTLITDIDQRIYKACNVPDFSDQKYASTSGAALISKCISFTNACNQYRTSLEDALDLLSEITTRFTYEWPGYFTALQEADEAVSGVRDDASNIADINN